MNKGGSGQKNEKLRVSATAPMKTPVSTNLKTVKSRQQVTSK